jgi:hypothetical protein
MVERLPPIAISLGGNDNVPIQAAIYYSPKQAVHDDDGDGRKVIAVTFQAHPEYATSKEKGLQKTLHSIIETMKERGDITDEERRHATDDAIREYDHVQEQSISVMVAAGRKLGWF